MLHRESEARRRRSRLGAPLVGSVLIAALFVGYLVAAGQSATADPARLVRDINPGESSSNPYNLVEMGGRLFFVADDGSYGRELWASDGTTAGTVRLTDIAPSSASANPSELTSVQGSLFFVASDTGRAPQLWSSDGTRAGTRRLKAFDPGTGSLSVSNLTAVGSRAFFVVTWTGTENQPQTRALWRSDGSEQGTVVVADIPATQLTDVQGTLFFVSSDPATGVELWQSDGTPGGTAMVADSSPGPTGSYPERLTNVNGTLFYVADNGSFEDGRELWKSDGTPTGTVQVKDINPGDASSEPTDLTANGAILVFVAYSPGNGRELWRSDGTVAGTTLLRDIVPGAPSSDPEGLISSNGTVYFIVGTELWRSDGTPAGTVMVADLAPRNGRFIETLPAQPQQARRRWHLVSAGGSLFIRNAGYFLWYSDGTARGTRLIHTARTSSYYNNNESVVGAGGFVFFVDADDLRGLELWAVPADPKLYVRFLSYLPLVRDPRPTPTMDDYYPPPIFPTTSPNATATMTPTPQQ